MKNVKVAILGLGTVGYGVYKIIKDNGAQMAKYDDVDLSVEKILVRTLEEPNVKKCVNMDICTTDIQDIIDSDANVVVECIGGEHPALEFILAALKAKKHVVTSNKEVIAKNWSEIEQVAKANGVGVYIEATVGGGIPIIRTVQESMQGNDITKIMGIINGTTNYILTKMTKEGADYADVLKEAQDLGYAEADPKNDVEGYDNMYKLSILGSLAFHTKVPIEVIFREGITKITAKDIQLGLEFGYVVKMLAIAKHKPNKIIVRVHPTMIPKDHPLANVNDAFNAVFLHGDNVDDIMLYGRGAGQLPTASAVVSDIVYAAKHDSNPVYATLTMEDDEEMFFEPDFRTAAFINLNVQDQVGVLAQISKILADNNVSVDSMVQKKKSHEGMVKLIFITHEAKEQSIKNAIDEILMLPAVQCLNNMIRVEH